MSINLRAGNSVIPGNVYTTSYAWGTDVPTGTAILALENPISSTKKVGFLAGGTGGWNIQTTLVEVTFTLRRGVKLSSGTLITAEKYNSSSPTATVLVHAGGSWTLGGLISTYTLILHGGMAYVPITLPTELELKAGEAIIMVLTTESAASTIFPNVSYVWYEL